MIIKLSAGYILTDYSEQIEIGQLFIKSIMKPYEGIPQDKNMRVLHNVLSIEGLTTRSIIIRSNITEEFWREVIVATQDFRVCALGTPGIGKTTSTCILIRLLLEQKYTVIYRVRRLDNKGHIYMFNMVSDSPLEIDVKILRENEFDYRNNKEINKISTYYVVDPGKTKDNCDLDADFKGKVIIVASPFDGHWGVSEFEKDREGVSGIFCYYPVWELDELLAARSYFGIRLDEDVIKDRYEKVGGIPRHIFQNKTKFLSTLQSQKNAINQLTEQQVQMLTLDNVNSAQTLDNGQPKSVIMVYKCPERNFREFTVSVASRHVARILVSRKMNFLWNVIIGKGGTRGSTSWLSFEIYCHNLMTSGDVSNFFDYKYHDGVELQELKDVPDIPVALQLGNCTKIKETRESLIFAAKREGNENVAFYSSHSTHPLFDFLYRKGNTLYAFQVCIGKEHPCKPYQLKDAIEEAGNGYEFLLHYLTFDKRYDTFKLDPANPFLNENSVFVRSSVTNNWTIKVVRVPSPDEDYGGPSKKPARYFIYDKLSHDNVMAILQKIPGLTEQLLNANTNENGQLDSLILLLTVEKLRACLRCLSVPAGGKKGQLIKRLQNSKQSFTELIEQLQYATELANQGKSHGETNTGAGN